MYAYLEGKFTYKNPALLYIDVNGVGYEVNISLNTYSDIQSLDAGRIYVYLQVREDAHVLYGFSQQREKEMFLMLVGVSGVGAATARMMLSSLRPEEIAAAIASGNARNRNSTGSLYANAGSGEGNWQEDGRKTGIRT